MMWACIITIVVGLWVMVSTTFFSATGQAANAHYICGPLLITFAVIALWDINRSVIKANLPVALALVVAALVLKTGTAIMLSDIFCSLIVAGCSLVNTKPGYAFGGGWKSLFQKRPLHVSEAEKEAMKQANYNEA